VDKRERVFGMKNETVDTSYSAIKDYENRLEKHFGVQTELRYAGFFDWGVLSKRRDEDPYQPTGGTTLVPESSFSTEQKLKLSFVKCERILDFGSSESGTSEGYMRNGTLEYFTLDSDPSAQTDYSELGDIPEEIKFDAVIAMEVFEHIPREHLIETVAGISNVMEKNSTIIATMPNICNWFIFHKDYDHKNPLRYNHLGAIFSLFGIEVIDTYLFEYRYSRFVQNVDAFKNNEALFQTLLSSFGMHPANQIAIVGIKKDDMNFKY
jgi:hypothetical protein